ncbi:MAG: tail fiber domain-containing protein [Bacteroidales bacterium]|nr:tail fiber domain-containing protein [Bacteroidales bacterium]
MAYAVHFRFQWRSQNDNVFRIDILEDGYSGSIVQRPLGGAPQLRRNKNGNICGSSLEFLAQAQINDEFVMLYTSDAQAFRVDLYNGSTLIWQGFITPELYSEPDIAPPYNVKVTATDNLGETKLSDYSAQGRVSVSSLLESILDVTGLDFPIHWLSTMRPSDPAAIDAEDMPDSVTVNFDHLAGKTNYDILERLLQLFHAVIVQQDCAWLIVRETDIEVLRSGATITAPDGATFSIADFGSVRTNDWWPVGYLSRTVMPAKRSKIIAAPNNWIVNLLPDTATSSTNANHVEPTDGSTPYYELNPVNSSQEIRTCQVVFQSPFSGFVPFKDLVLSLDVQTWGLIVNPVSPPHTPKWGAKCAEVNVKILGTDGTNVVEKYIDNQGGFHDSAVSALDVDAIYREVAETFYINLPLYTKMVEVGYTKIYQITVTITTYPDDGGYSRMNISNWYLNVDEQNAGYQVTCELNNAARGKDDNVDLPVADNDNKEIEGLFVTNGLKLSSAVTAHADESIEEWQSDSIPSMALLELLARDYCLSIAVPRLRMEGRMNVPAGEAMPLLFRGGGLIYWPETWDWNLKEDAVDISMLSLPAAAITVTSIARTAEGSGGSIGGYASGSGTGGGVNFFEEDGNGGVKLKDEYNGLWAAGFMSAGGINSGGGGGGGVDMGRVWQDLTNNSQFDYTNYSSTTKIDIGHIPMLDIWKDLSGDSSLASYNANTKIAESHIPDISTSKISNLGSWSGSANITTLGTITTGTWNGSTIDVAHGGTGRTSFPDAYAVLVESSSGGIGNVTNNNTSTRKYLSQVNGGVPSWESISVSTPVATSSTVGGFKTGFSSANRNYAVQINDSDQAYVNVPWSNTDTTYKLKINGTTYGDYTFGTNLGTVYSPTSTGTQGYLLVADSNGYPDWTNKLTLTGSIDNNVALQVGTSSANRNMRIYGEIRFNGDTAKLNYTTAGGIAVNTDFKVGTASAPKDATVYGKLSVAGNGEVDGNLYIGGTTAYINYVSGNSGLHTNVGFYSDSFISAGGVSSSSDERMKTNLQPLAITVDQIAGAPAVEFDWMLPHAGHGAGSIAQYWERFLPYNVRECGGFKTMEYGNIALISAIMLARRVKELEEEIETLRRAAA